MARVKVFVMLFIFFLEKGKKIVELFCVAENRFVPNVQPPEHNEHKNEKEPKGKNEKRVDNAVLCYKIRWRGISRNFQGVTLNNIDQIAPYC